MSHTVCCIPCLPVFRPPPKVCSPVDPHLVGVSNSAHWSEYSINPHSKEAVSAKSFPSSMPLTVTGTSADIEWKGVTKGVCN